MRKTWVRFLGREDIPWRRKWQPTPVFLPGESHGQRSLVGCSPRGHKELDMTERIHFTSLSIITSKNFNGLSEGMGLEMEYGTFWLTDSCLDLGMTKSRPLQWRIWFNHTLPFTCYIYYCCSACALFFVKFFACKDLEEFERHSWPLQVAFQEHLYHRLPVGLDWAESPCWTDCVLQPKQKKWKHRYLPTVIV